jgi:hypothetical protein
MPRFPPEVKVGVFPVELDPLEPPPPPPEAFQLEKPPGVGGAPSSGVPSLRPEAHTPVRFPGGEVRSNPSTPVYQSAPVLEGKLSGVIFPAEKPLSPTPQTLRAETSIPQETRFAPSQPTLASTPPSAPGFSASILGRGETPTISHQGLSLSHPSTPALGGTGVNATSR